MLPINISFQELNYTNLDGSTGQSFTCLWNQFNGENIDGDTLASRLCRAKAAVIVAINSSQMVLGFVCFSCISSPVLCTDYIEIWALFVSPVARMCGIGRALIEQVERHSITAHPNVRFFVSAEEAQMSFYQKCGYELGGAVRMTRKCYSKALDTNK